MYKRIIKGFLLIGVIFINLYLFISYKYKNEKWLNDEICKFAKQEVKSKVINKGGHGRYNWLIVNDSSRYYYQISKIVIDSFNKNTYKIDVGDSIVKVVNSKKIIVYRGNKKSIYILRCKE